MTILYKYSDIHTAISISENILLIYKDGIVDCYSLDRKNASKYNQSSDLYLILFISDNLSEGSDNALIFLSLLHRFSNKFKH